jgi:hypothetical protein
VAVGDPNSPQFLRVLHRNGAQADGIDELKVAVLAPTPRERVRTATEVKPGLRRRNRKA